MTSSPMTSLPFFIYFLLCLLLGKEEKPCLDVKFIVIIALCTSPLLQPLFLQKIKKKEKEKKKKKKGKKIKVWNAYIPG